MKQPLLLLAGLMGLTVTAFSQTPTTNENTRHLMSIESKKINKFHGVLEGSVTIKPENQNPGSEKSTNTNVGASTYQLQTNSGIENRIVYNSDGTIGAVFTFSDDPGSTWPDRGTGYVYNDGVSWSAAPSIRVEAVRTGWPTLLVLGDNSEVLISHNTATTNDYDIYFSKRPVKGTGAWTENATILANPGAPYGNLWPRAAVGGSNDMSIHMISISFPTDPLVTTTPAYFMGQQGALTYCRSTNGGTSWDIMHNVNTLHDSTQYSGFDADAYDLDARGNTVAYVAGGFTNDVFLMKSTDNGTNWTKTIVYDFPIDLFVDQLIDTTATNDGSLHVLLDTNDVAHVFFGNMNILNDDTTDAQISYFPGTSGLLYWNEGMAPNSPVLIADLEDVDGDLAITVTAWGTYQTSLSSFPSAGVDNTNALHLTYSALVENSDDGGGNNIRNVYYTKSIDGGANWITPVRVLSDDFTEQVYASMAREVDPTCISMIYQSDVAVGHGVGATNPDAGSNIGNAADMIYVCYELYSGVNEYLNLSEGVSIYPNPSHGNVNVQSLFTINKVDIISCTGAVLYSFNPQSQQYTMNLENLASGIYMIKSDMGDQSVVKRVVKN